ncbi:MAG: transketolase C-terminal domain-containing protein [Candidatus Omnitrophota bacterium]|nr:transketolase C-terminal domain-containing protein [Candidatus Omnitrophota bacterium]
MRNAYLSALYDLAKENKNIMALISDNGAIVYDQYRADFPEQYLNCGISEANMVGVSAGLASCGKIPFAYTIANFIVYRAFEQIRNDVCLQKMNVKLVGIGVGFVYSILGPTHHTTEDIALMRALPNMTIFSPCDPREAKKVTYAAAQINGPVYIRLATGGTPKVYEKDYDFQVGRGVVLREGRDLTMISTGSILLEALQAADQLKAEGVGVRFINMHTLKPMDQAIILKAARETSRILIVEDQNLQGGLGSAVAETLADNAVVCRFKRLGLQDVFTEGYGSYQDLKEINGIAKKNIKDAAKGLLEA